MLMKIGVKWILSFEYEWVKSPSFLKQEIVYTDRSDAIIFQNGDLTHSYRIKIDVYKPFYTYFPSKL
jgi:hypothetical protein